MTFHEYQLESSKTAIYPCIEEGYMYPLLGLISETGELAGCIKKIWRDYSGFTSDADKILITKELGDILWHLTQIATEFNMGLDTIAKQNIEKLRDRQERNVLHGKGDNR